MSKNRPIVLPVAVVQATDVCPKEVVAVCVDEEGTHVPSRHQAIMQAQAIAKKFTKGRTGLVQEFLNERRDAGCAEVNS